MKDFWGGVNARLNEECKVGLVRREYLTAYALLGVEVGEEKVRAY